VVFATPSNEIKDMLLDSSKVPPTSFGDLMEARGIDVEAFDFDEDFVLGDRKRWIDPVRLLWKNALGLDDPL
jgi:hypothetical protein